MAKINLAEKLHKFSDHWSPRTVGSLNNYSIKVVRAFGEYTWHRHTHTDEFFMVIYGRLTIQLRDGDVQLEPGELYVVPRGVEHCPTAAVETTLLLIEPRGTVSSGDP